MSCCYCWLYAPLFNRTLNIFGNCICSRWFNSNGSKFMKKKSWFFFLFIFKSSYVRNCHWAMANANDTKVVVMMLIINDFSWRLQISTISLEKPLKNCMCQPINKWKKYTYNLNEILRGGTPLNSQIMAIQCVSKYVTLRGQSETQDQHVNLSLATQQKRTKKTKTISIWHRLNDLKRNCNNNILTSAYRAPTNEWLNANNHTIIIWFVTVENVNIEKMKTAHILYVRFP